jgi:hypothetical protein
MMNDITGREHPSLNQVSDFVHYASQDKHLKDLNWQGHRLEEMTLKQYKYVKFLWTNNHYFKLKEILTKFL